ncbi:MAG: bifunctional pyr operon transcriptional regulator/uracil phosphoribosyltransferase PyrR [Alcanivorax sp.]|jgi:pyrimidine operon attenuation protein/uracil phosphoribosyltransferase|nr:bifunctional pyr operon transcriptional regulator/uracil phosphoribosyltransferase PyrR [Alcanivorax sp.]
MLGLSPCKHGSYSKDNLLESPLSWDEQQLQTHLDTMAGAITEQYGDRAPLLVGIESGGAWVARALNGKLAEPLPLGTLNPAFYRDDFDTRGLKRTVTPSKLPFEVDGQHILLVDDVLMTGRTIRAAMNELFDFGRPASIALVVLFDIGHRELPIRADICGETLALPPHQRVELRGPAPLVAEIRDTRPEE